MANINCDQCGENPAATIMTNIVTGDVTSVCAGCFPGFILALAEAIIGTPPSPEATADAEGLAVATTSPETTPPPGQTSPETPVVPAETPEPLPAPSPSGSPPDEQAPGNTPELRAPDDDDGHGQSDPTPPTRKPGRSRAGSSPRAAAGAADRPAETTVKAATKTKP